MPEKGYDNGVTDTLVKTLLASVKSIEGKLDANLEWQRGVDARLAAGNVRFDNLEGDVKMLKSRDGIVGGIAVALSALAAIFGIKN